MADDRFDLELPQRAAQRPVIRVAHQRRFVVMGGHGGLEDQS